MKLLLTIGADRRFLALFDQAILSVTSVVISVVIARVCTKQELGLYASGLSFILLATAIQNALICTPFIITTPQLSREALRTYKGSTVLQAMVLSGLSMLLFFASGFWTSIWATGSDLGGVLMALGVCSGSACFREFARSVSFAELNFRLALLIDSIACGAQVCLILSLAVLGKLSAVKALIALGCSSGIASFIWIIFSANSWIISSTYATRDLSRNWYFGKWLFSSSVLWSISINQYPWMIAASKGATEASTWASCYGVIGLLNPIVLALNNDAAPRISHDFAFGGLSNLKQSVLRTTRAAAILTLPLVLGLLLFGSDLVHFIYGYQYTGSSQMVGLLAAGFFSYACSLAFPYALLALRQQKLDFVVNVICFVTFLIVGPRLIQTLGALGAACSLLAIQVVALISRFVAYHLALKRAQWTIY